VCHLHHCQTQHSYVCFVASVTDISGDLKIWLDTDVIASDRDAQQEAVIV